MIGERSRSAERTLMFAEAADASNAVRAQQQYDSGNQRAIGVLVAAAPSRTVITLPCQAWITRRRTPNI